MSKFKVGDRIRVTAWPSFWSGKFGTVIDPNDGDAEWPVSVQLPLGYESHFNEDELELISDPKRDFAEARRDDPSNDAMTTRYWVGYLDGFDAAGAS